MDGRRLPPSRGCLGDLGSASEHHHCIIVANFLPVEVANLHEYIASCSCGDREGYKNYSTTGCFIH